VALKYLGTIREMGFGGASTASVLSEVGRDSRSEFKVCVPLLICGAAPLAALQSPKASMFL